MAIVPVILSGGSGTRLWPVSRRQYPKQLLPLVGEATMLQQTVARLDGLDEVAAPVVVCNHAHADVVVAQLDAIGRAPSAVVLEPVGRSTAPAVALAALTVLAATAPDDEDPLLLVLPADHVVLNTTAFREAVALGRPLAASGKLITFGIKPDHPHTGFGYILAEDPTQPSPVRAFVEKPDQATAERYLREGGYYWNSGMFLLGARAYVEELRRWRPDIAVACQAAVDSATRVGPVVRADADAFAACPVDSIDYAVMEKTDRAAVVPMDAGWSDVGSWAALHGVREHDACGNDLRGEVVAVDCDGSLLHAGHRVLAAIGLRDMVVVETEDAVLVTPRARAEEVKTVVTALRERGLPQATTHPVAARSWGTERALGGGAEGVTLTQLTIRAGRHTESTTSTKALRVVVVGGRGELVDGEGRHALSVGGTRWVAAGEPYSLAASEEALQVLVVAMPAVAEARS